MAEDGIVIIGLEKLSDSSLEQLEKIVRAYRLHGAPKDYWDEDIQIRYVKEEDSVVLLNGDYDELILDDEKGMLERYYYSPYDGFGGTYAELLGEYENFNDEDRSWFDTEIRSIERDIEVMISVTK
jgi:hypothetical protein